MQLGLQVQLRGDATPLLLCCLRDLEQSDGVVSHNNATIRFAITREPLSTASLQAPPDFIWGRWLQEH